jgi:glutaredoxin/phenylpyruvate tautomerase PptA (4-oxalocrotonate tautomerase family)
MPYIAIKGYPKDEETVRKVAERINETLLELWGCPQAAINISYEAISPDVWDERMERGEIAQNRDKMLLYAGKWVSSAKKLTILHLDNCPYCRKARQALAELQAENPAYRAVAIEWIEEERESEAASRYTDYYYVPTIYAGDRKLYEAHPGDGYETIKAEVKRALEAVL